MARRSAARRVAQQCPQASLSPVTAVSRSASWPKRPAWPSARSACGVAPRVPGAGPRSGSAPPLGTDDVARIRLVLADRERGLSLAAAIERAVAWSPAARGSIFSIVREYEPRLPPLRLPFWAMLALSRAIEDECLARAGRPVVAGSFQTERAYRIAEHRWREIARTAALSFVLAEFGRARAPRGGPLEIPVAADRPVRREWSLVCLDRHYTVCLVAWELPQDSAAGPLRRSGRRRRRWSVPPSRRDRPRGATLRPAPRGRGDRRGSAPGSRRRVGPDESHDRLPRRRAPCHGPGLRWHRRATSTTTRCCGA